MVTVPLVMENLFVIATMITLEQTVLSEIFVQTINVNIVQHVLLGNQIIHATVPLVFMENIVSKLTFVPAVRVKTLESVAIMRRVSHANAWQILLDYNAKHMTSVLVKIVTDAECVCCKTMGTFVTVLRDTVAGIANIPTIVLVSFVTITGRA